MISNCLQNPRGPRGTQQSFIREGSAPRSNPLPLSREAALDFEGVRTGRKTRAPTEALQTGGLRACSPRKFDKFRVSELPSLAFFHPFTAIKFFIYLFIYLIAFTMVTILKKTREKQYIWTRHKSEGRRCGTHNRARLQIKCALTENTQILTM